MRHSPWKTAVLVVVALAILLAVASHAAPPARAVKIAVLTPGLSFSEVLEGFREGLRQLGYENANLTLLVEDTKGTGADVKAQAQTLVAAKPDVVVTVGTSHTVAAKAATSTIPSVPVAVNARTIGARVQAANRHAGELLECAAASMVGSDLGEIVGRECSAASTEHLLLACTGGLGAAAVEGANGDLEMPSLSRVLHWEARATRDVAGRTTGLTITVHDVTQEREIAQMKSDFVSFATHQLRTPLSGIKWMLELGMQEPDVPDSATSYMKDALDSSQRLIQLVNDLLDVSRLESGRMKATPQPVDLLGLTRTVLDDLKLQLEDKDHQLMLEPVADLPEVFADPQLLARSCSISPRTRSSIRRAAAPSMCG
jgi:signal transduction histidine kinase